MAQIRHPWIAAILASVPTPLVIFPAYVYPMFQKGPFLKLTLLFLFFRNKKATG
jgi:hypothetical protein